MNVKCCNVFQGFKSWFNSLFSQVQTGEGGMIFPLSSFKRCKEVTWPPGWVMSLPPFTFPQQLLPSPESYWCCILHIPTLLLSFLISNLSPIWASQIYFHQDSAGLYSIHPWASKGVPRNMICHMKYQLEMRLSALFIPCYQFQLCSWLIYTLCCSQPSLSPGIVKDPLDVS